MHMTMNTRVRVMMASRACAMMHAGMQTMGCDRTHVLMSIGVITIMP